MIVCKSDAELRRMRAATQVVADVLQALRELVRPGVTTAELDEVAEAMIRAAGGVPSFKGYHGFPATLCTSVNEQIIHGIPSPQVKLREGDILSIDVGVLLDGFHGDAAITVPIGRIDAKADELLKVTEESLYAGIEKARVGGRVSGHRARRAAARGSARVLGRPRVRGARRRGRPPRGAPGAQLRAARAGPEAGGRHGAGDRADGGDGAGRRSRCSGTAGRP